MSDVEGDSAELPRPLASADAIRLVAPTWLCAVTAFSGHANVNARSRNGKNYNASDGRGLR